MSGATHDRALPWLLALATAAVLLAFGSRDVFWAGDFIDEAWPAYVALQRDGWDAFVGRLPGYSGFTVLIGAPAALLGEALGWLDTGVFRATALPGLAALVVFGARLGAHARRAGSPGWPLVVVLGAGGPIGYQALAYGHPEDVLAAALAVAAVLAAVRDRPNLAAIMLVGAVVSKQWAVLAILPAALAAPHGRIRIVLIGGAATTALVAVQLFVAQGAATTIVNTGALFHPHQVWWPLGVPAPAEFSAGGHGELMAPAWLQPLTRPLLLMAGALASAAWCLRARGRTAGNDDALALLALVFALRCALDPWNLVYYHLPLTLALVAWEARRGRPYPVLSLSVSAFAWLSFVTYDARTGMGPFLLYFAWMAPLIGALALRLLAPARTRAWVGHAPLPAPA